MKIPPPICKKINVEIMKYLCSQFHVKTICYKQIKDVVNVCLNFLNLKISLYKQIIDIKLYFNKNFNNWLLNILRKLNAPTMCMLHRE